MTIIPFSFVKKRLEPVLRYLNTELANTIREDDYEK